ncbi:hypothetical protein [Pseudoalteromonas rubra]|uniref:Uncharacterized protein n=1 Tax=Pseudoalteromonas rubra TaxID=43658 RepID=A0A0F4QPW8_9GAMM|nr:hypothetical protein [Pseudoalteromonas rubra]KJZ09379.1 hypothetical protein TW77_10140 [Pseudoalteromonas rubra]
MKIGTQGSGLVQPTTASAHKAQASPQNNHTKQSNDKGLIADVYHKNAGKNPAPTYARPVSISSNKAMVTKTVDEALNDIALATAHLYTPSGALSQSVERMTKQFDQIMSELNAQQPQLANKHWGISVAESGELQVTGALTDDERTLVEQRLNENDEFVSAANEFKSSYLKYIDMEVRGWAQYDVNAENFSQIFDLKDMLDSSKSEDNFKSAWGYESNWMKLHDNIAQQLSRKARYFAASE